jgi:hypothetical protein
MSTAMPSRLRSMIVCSFITSSVAGLAACGGASDGSAPAPTDPATVGVSGPNEAPAAGVNCPTRGTLESPTMPQAVAPPAGSQLFLRVYAEGTQKYACQAGANGAAWTFVAPEAKLYDDRCVLVGSHFAGPTWKFDKDGSAVVGKKAGEAPSPTAGSIPWLLLATNMTTGTGTAAAVTYVNRIDTVAGAAPSEGCDSAGLGKEIAVPYTATYLFYRAAAPTTAPGTSNPYPY